MAVLLPFRMKLELAASSGEELSLLPAAHASKPCPQLYLDTYGCLLHTAVLCSGMRGDQARKTCPELQLVQVPTAHGKADLTLYRDAGKQV